MPPKKSKHLADLQSSAARLIENSEYRPAFSKLYNGSGGARRALHRVLHIEVRKEIYELLNTDCCLEEPCDMDSSSGFSWEPVLEEMQQNTPLLYTAIESAITSKKSETDMICPTTRRDLQPTIGLVLSMLLHMRRPTQFKFMQGVDLSEFWKCWGSGKKKVPAATDSEEEEASVVSPPKKGRKAKTEDAGDGVSPPKKGRKAKTEDAGDGVSPPKKRRKAKTEDAGDGKVPAATHREEASVKVPAATHREEASVKPPPATHREEPLAKVPAATHREEVLVKPPPATHREEPLAKVPAATHREEVLVVSPPKKGRKAKTEDAGDGETKAAKSKKAKAEEKSKLRKEASLTEGLDFCHETQTADGRNYNIKIASWNINGIRAWLDKGGLSYIKDESPDVLCLQETKCSLEEIPDDVKVEGYHSYWSSAEQAGYAGTGLLSKVKPITVDYGLGIKEHDSEGRVITAEYEKFFLVTSYVPNSGRGLPRLPYRTKKWDVDFKEHLNKLDKKKPVIMCGDLNVAHQEIDLANPKTNKKTAGFTTQEREGFTDLLAAGYIDSFRELYPEQEQAYTFWTYMGNARGKNVGWRLDYFVLSERLKKDLCDNVIRKDVMGSDHCPIVLFMAL